MLTSEQQFVLDLLKLSLGVSTSTTVPEAIDAVVVAAYIRRNGIMPTVYPWLKVFPKVQQMLEAEYYASISQSVNQDYEGNRVLQALGVAGMDCMGLKGWEMRSFYPSTAMRQMTDLDLLVRDYDSKAVRRVLESLGYKSVSQDEADMHDVFVKGAVAVEAHRRLTNNSIEIRAWESVMWNRALSVGEGVFRMSLEDCYIFHFTHMHRDFHNGWFGLRRVVDAWLLDCRRDEMDQDYVRKQLDSLGIARFVDRMCWLGRVCLGEESPDKDAELLVSYALETGIYGTDKSHKAGRMVWMSRRSYEGSRIRSALTAVFQPYERMSMFYPALEKWPILLPAYWIRWIARKLKSGRIDQYRSMLDYSDITEEDYERMHRVLEVGGCL